LWKENLKLGQRLNQVKSEIPHLIKRSKST